MKIAASRIVDTLGEIWIRCKVDQKNVLWAGLHKYIQFFLFLSRQFVGFQFCIQNLNGLLKGLALLLRQNFLKASSYQFWHFC
jgi:hypothetical protein